MRLPLRQEYTPFYQTLKLRGKIAIGNNTKESGLFNSPHRRNKNGSVTRKKPKVLKFRGGAVPLQSGRSFYTTRLFVQKSLPHNSIWRYNVLRSWKEGTSMKLLLPTDGSDYSEGAARFLTHLAFTRDDGVRLSYMQSRGHAAAYLDRDG